MQAALGFTGSKKKNLMRDVAAAIRLDHPTPQHPLDAVGIRGSLGVHPESQIHGCHEYASADLHTG